MKSLKQVSVSRWKSYVQKKEKGYELGVKAAVLQTDLSC